MKIPCSNCNQRLEIPEELAGQTIECPACNESLDVPAMAAKPPAPIQQSAPQVAASEKPKSSKLKLAIAAVAGTAVVVIASIMFFSDTKIEPVTEVAQTEQPKVIAPEIAIQETAKTGNIEAVKQHLEGNMMMPYGMGNMPTMGMNPMMGMPGTGFGVPKDFDPKEIFKQEIEEINQRLLKGELLNQYNDQGDTELMVAARANDLDLAKRLLGKKANPNLKVNLEEDDFGAGETALHIAAKAEHKAMCELLYKNGALLNVKDEMGFTPLDSILSNFEPQMNPMDPFSGKKVKPKMTRKGRETIAYLRGKGGKNMTVKQREAVMATNDPFQHMMGGMDDFTKQLQKIESYGSGPNDSPEGFNEEINKINQMMFQMMPFATSESEAPTVKLSNIPIINAAMNGNIETTKKAISDGADVNSKDEFGFTALHYTAWYGQTKIVELLIAKGADVNAKVLSGAKKGFTPLDLNFINVEISKSEGGSGSKIYTETADLLRKHGGKTGEELKAEGK